MKALILSVGDELILGQTVDTNSAWLSAQLAALGCEIVAHKTVGDDRKAIERAIEDGAREVDALIISGGIGPTEDDLTRQALAAVMGVDLVLNEKWLTTLHEFFRSRGRPMPETNKIQAMIPRGATIIENTAGTAAGIRVRLPVPQAVDRGDAARSSSCEIFVMPGVPKEMKIMFTRDVLPWIKEQSRGAVILSRTLHTFGLGESAIAEMLGDLMKRDRNPSVGTTVANGIVSLRVNARFESRARAEGEINNTVTLCQDKLGDLIFGTDDNELQDVVVRMLIASNQTVTTAESCTGGLVAKMITDVPGSSAILKTGFITYSNQSKYERLGVSEQIIGTYGAVSERVVEAMARNARRLAHAEYALSISGIAGPDGGSPAKPVGTVCIGLAHPLPPEAGRREGAWQSECAASARTFTFPGDREWVRDRSAKMALTMLRYHLLGRQMPF